MNPQPKKQKVILLGWDAADWKIINPLMDQGLMPNLKKLVEGGSIGKLKTLDPAFSPMIWTSMATGKRPYKHGVLGFQEVRPNRDGIQPIMGTSRKVKAIWNILGDKGYKTHVVGWWPSHPAEPINGICISDMYQKSNMEAFPKDWKMSDACVYPREMAAHFKQLRVHPRELNEQHLLPFVPELGKINQKRGGNIYGLAQTLSHAASLHSAFTNILRTQEWDFAALYLDAIDHFCHGFMKYHPPHRPNISKADYDLYHRVVTGAYQFHDMMLRRIMDFVDEHTTILLVSDHGFQPDHLRPKILPNEPASPALEHSPYGIIAAQGPGIKKDSLLYGASVLDLTPTILNIFGLPTGLDMDGKILNNIFEKPVDIPPIETWENTEGFHRTDEQVGEDEMNIMLKQLEDLGYIEKTDSANVEKSIRRVERELDYNLACSYIDGRQLFEAIEVLEGLQEKYPNDRRFLYKLATCYQSVNDLKKCRTSVDALRAMDIYNSGTLDVLEGSLLLGEKKPNEAMAMFKRAEENVDPNTSKIYFMLARCHFMVSRFENALRLLEKEKQINPDEPMVYQLMAKCYTKQQEYAQAAEHALEAIALDFQNPVSHFVLGFNLFHLGRYEEATTALENVLKLAPDYNDARKLLMTIYQTHLNKPDQAIALRKAFEQKIEGTIYIVSGMPRSGTSMMMQMLHKGGLDVFTDRKREADENNSKGYFEHELVKSLPRNKSWLSDANQKAVKIIANLLPHLPGRFKYKIIFMERSVPELLQSQTRMLQRLGKRTGDEETYPLSLADSFQKSIDRALQWMTHNPNVEYIRINYPDVIENPFEQALHINAFLGNILKPELMATAVDGQLYREKSR